MFATQILPETLSDDLKEENHTVVGFIVVDDEKHEIKKGETKIGRDPSVCSIAIENSTVSKVHAVIESDGIDDTFIYDVGSTNQTRLGKKLLKPHCRYKLDNGSNITLGSIVVKFILPPDKSSNVILDETSKENYNSLDDYGDIFEVATQAIVPQSNASYRVPAFEIKSKNFQTLKIQNAKTKGSHGQSESVFDLQTQCKLDSLETISKTENHNGLHDYSEIFELSTQCQIHESQIVRENRSKVTSEQEVDELKSFLNDGQDDVLCAVISLHSPKELGNDDVEKKIKTEIENLSQVLDAPTQVQAIVKESQEENAEVNGSLQDKDFSTRNPCLPTSERTDVNSWLKINNSSNSNCAQLIEEDVIKTQEFGINESQKKCQQGNPSLDKMTPTSLERISTDNSLMKESHDEDSILTQSFEAPLNIEPAIVIPESEDFMETQIYDVENEKRADEKMRLGWSYDATADFTQQDKEDDFVATQVFKESEEGKGTNGSNEKNVHSNDEDFVATQAFKESVKVKRTDGNYEKNMINDDEDFILTQAFKEPVEANRTDGNYDKNVGSDDEDFIETQAFKEPVESNRTDGKNAHSYEEDFIATQAFKEPVEAKRTDGNNENSVTSDGEDFITTQELKEPVTANRNEGNYEKNVGGDDEDFVATQAVESPNKGVINSEDSRIEKSSRESSPDLLALGGPCKDSEDCIATQMFEPVESHNARPTFPGFSENLTSAFFSDYKKDDSIVVRTKAPEVVESSGDETESDLEILLDKHETSRKYDKIIENCQEIQSESFQNHQKGLSSRDSNDVCDFKFKRGNAEEIQSKRKQISDSSDSDATDCEEIAVLNQKVGVKHEPAEPIEFEETQVLTLTPPNNFIGKTCDGCTIDGESPKFENRDDSRPWSPLSLEMPNTQDMETSVKRRNEIGVPEKCENTRDFPPDSSNLEAVEVGIESARGSTSFWTIEPSKKKVHSPKKRAFSDNDVQVVPVKKSKTEDRLVKNRENQFSKLVQAHDISQIQPNRTRNSVKNTKVEVKNDFPGESSTNIVRPTSRRKINTKRGSTKALNCDITPYLIKEGRRYSRGRPKKETTLSENKGSKPVAKIESSTRVLRSSLRNDKSPKNLVKPPERRVFTRSSTRTSRTKSSEYSGSWWFSVAFTGFDCPSFEKVIRELGGEKVEDVSRCGVVVADKVRRTVKFLCAVGLSLPIASPQWLVSCKKEKKFLNPWDFILKDDEAENTWDFELRTSLERSKRGKLLEGFNIFATKNTKPPVKDLLAIVECCGGTPLFEPPEIWPKKTIIVSCLEDKKCWPPAKLRNVQVVHYEFILSGVLRQKIDFKTYKLR